MVRPAGATWRVGAPRAGTGPAGAIGIVRCISPLRDIEDRADCERLVRAFYGRALRDPIIGWIFTDVAELDLDEHVPRITSFWETVLLGAKSYTGGAFHPHAALHARVPLRAGHFRTWIALWHTTVDALFSGERADEAKRHADRLAFAFQGRLRTLTPPPQDPPTGSGLTITRHGPSGDAG